MDSLKYLLSVATLALFNICISQTGPGGVGNSTSNGLWLKADNITLANGSLVNTWGDTSGNGNNALSAATQQPVFFSTSALNNMPTVRLDGINDQMIINDAAILDGTSAITFITVLRPNNLNGNPRGILGKRQNYNINVDYAYTWFFHNSNYLNVDINTQNNRFNSSPTTFANGTNYILQMHYDGTLPSGQRSKIYNNQNLIAQSTESSTSIINSASDLVLGALNLNYGTYLGADYSEVIHYNYALNTAEQIIVNNYLSAKYDVALSSDDIYIQDDVGRGNFDHNVAGIGQASDGSNHTDSQGTGIVRINNPRALGNNEFLFWGEETRNATYNFSTNTSTHTEQLNSRWRIRRSGDLGRVDISFDISSIDLSGKQGCSPLQLIVDNNYDFSSPEDVYDLTIVGSAATATNVRLNQNRYFTLRYVDEIVREGTNYFNGSGVANAPDNTNDCLKFTVKSGAVSNINTNIHVRSVEVETGGVLNILDGNLLEVENEVIVDGTINLLGEAQLIQNHTGTTSNSGSGSLTKPQQGVSSFYNYNYWSAPVNIGGNWQVGYLEDAAGVVNFSNALNGNASSSPITLSSRWLYRFNGTTDDYSQWIKISPTSNLLPAEGYTMKGSGAVTANQEYIFRGIPNDGDYSRTVTAGNDFLTGNPYPSALDADQFITDNLSVIDGTLYFWEQFTTNNSHILADYQGGHATYNLMGMGMPATADASGLTSSLGIASIAAPERYIPVGQGFFVSVQNSGSLVFNNGQRFFARESLGESVFFKTDKNINKTIEEDTRTKIWFSFTKPDTFTKYIGLGYDSNASYDYDNGYDAPSYDQLRNDISWSLNNNALIIQALQEINTKDVLPLHVVVSDADFYNFSISKIKNVPDDLNIFLKDNLKNSYYNLREGEANLFLNSETEPDQFSIVFQKESTLGTVEFETANTIFTSYNTNSKELKLHTKEAIEHIKSYKFYNSIGQEIMYLKSPKTQTISIKSLSDGIYILEIDAEGFKSPKKIKFVKY